MEAKAQNTVDGTLNLPDPATGPKPEAVWNQFAAKAEVRARRRDRAPRRAAVPLPCCAGLRSPASRAALQGAASQLPPGCYIQAPCTY